MSAGFVQTLAAVVVVVLGARVVASGLPLRWAARMSGAGVGLFGVGIAGLAFHCAAMFFRSRVAAVPGTSAAVDMINALGTGSVVWYVVSAGFVVAGLRRQRPAAVSALGVALVAVGVTMYDGGPLAAHLASIFATVVLLAGVAAVLVLPPWRPRDPA